jgi:hypothetical protein
MPLFNDDSTDTDTGDIRPAYVRYTIDHAPIHSMSLTELRFLLTVRPWMGPVSIGDLQSIRSRMSGRCFDRLMMRDREFVARQSERLLVAIFAGKGAGI